MKKYIGLLLLLISLSLHGEVVRDYYTVKGRVTVKGKGVAGVRVTDGVSIVLTNKKGEYKLPTHGGREFIYITQPTGYRVPIIQGAPSFYQLNKRGERVDFSLELDGDQTKHGFVVWADPQMKDEKDLQLFKEMVLKFKLQLNEKSSGLSFHGLSCGDQVFNTLSFYTDYKKELEGLGIPFYQTIGNHDLNFTERTNEVAFNTYTEAFGPRYFSFDVGEVHYVVLNNVFYYGYKHQYIGYLNEEQLGWLEKDLSFVPHGKTVVITFHIPAIYGHTGYAPKQDALMKNSLINNKALFKIVEPYNTHILTGHSHTQWNTRESEQLMEHVHGSIGGGFWENGLCLDGNPQGVTWYFVEGDSISWYFQGLESPRDFQFRVYPLGYDDKNPDFIVVNVFNYDTKWKVQWYEDGQRIDSLEKFWGTDPYARRVYHKEMSERYPWLSAWPTGHLFRFKPHNPSAKIEVKVTDSFGNEFVQKVQ